MKRWISLLLVLAMALPLTACKNEEEPIETVSPEVKILQDRRTMVEQHMREALSVLWRPQEDIVYHVGSGTREYKLEAGRLYRGVPYAYASGTRASFLEFAGTPDENGIYTISGLDGLAMTGGSTDARIGSDCSSTLTAAWSVVSSTLNACVSREMTKENGVIPVGEYEFCPTMDGEDIVATKPVIEKNGAEVMFKAYAQAQKGDALMHIYDSASGSNHVMMVVSSNVVYTDKGLIDGAKSTFTVLEQTRTNFNAGKTTTLVATGETVHIIGGMDVEYTFLELLGDSYIPLTVKELVDASAPVAEVVITDSVTQHSKDTIFTGTISSNYFIDSVTFTITDSTGKELQKAAASVTRWSNKDFDMQKFLTDNAVTIRGEFDLELLDPGTYHMTVVCRLAKGDEKTVRDFDFTV